MEISRCLASGGSSLSISPQTCSKTFFDANPAMSPPTMLNGRNRSFNSALLRLGSRLHPHPMLGRHPGLQLPAALELRVELGSKQHRDVRDPEPHEKGNDAAERTVGLVVGAELGHVEREQRRGRDPHDYREQATRGQPAETRLLHV